MSLIEEITAPENGVLKHVARNDQGVERNEKIAELIPSSGRPQPIPAPTGGWVRWMIPDNTKVAQGTVICILRRDD